MTQADLEQQKSRGGAQGSDVPAGAVAHNPLRELSDKCDQAVWLDYIQRRMLNDGELKRLVDEDGLRGVTSNPAIFEKAIGGSNDYDAAISELVHNSGDLEPGQLFEQLAVDDIRHAAQILAPVYERTAGGDGFISIEVSPYLAYDTQKTIEEARRLWRKVAQPNLMVKVPGTHEGLPAIQQLISEGININITLLFSQKTYEQVAYAYIAGLEALSRAGGDISHVASVASFFVSRIDTMADKLIVQAAAGTTSDAGNGSKSEAITNLQGKVAIANAKLAYQIYLDICKSPRWKALEAKGAKPQRLLWASTSTKNPAYPATLYVDELIGRHTVNTIPPDTMAAFRASGHNVRESLIENVEAAKKVLDDLQAAGVSLDKITTQLTADGVALFADAADKLLGAVAQKRLALLGNKHNSVSYSLGGTAGGAGGGGAKAGFAAAAAGSSGKTLEGAVNEKLEDWRKEGKIRRLWNRDSSLWTGSDESKWLDWLHMPRTAVGADARATAGGANTPATTSGADTHAVASDAAPAPGAAVVKVAREAAQWVKEAGFKHAVLLGMGGSSLGAEVMQTVFGKAVTAACGGAAAAASSEYPALHVLDSTDPAQIKAIEEKIDYARTLFIVSSKSGTTMEPNLLKDYFFENLKARLGCGGGAAGRQFIAVTDPGSALESLVKHDGFAHTYPGVPGIGGRYSVLSNFGMIPGAVQGMNVEHFLSSARTMAYSCGGSVPPAENPGVRLGAVLGAAAAQGKDKITVITSPSLTSFGAWLEQLFAESTGKEGRGLIPVAGEQVGAPQLYGNDRLFIYIRDGSGGGAATDGTHLDTAIDALEKAGHPVVRITVFDRHQLGQEFFRFEMATAVAGSIIGINAFNQPDVEASKQTTRELTAQYEKQGSIPQQPPFFEAGGVQLYADEANQKALQQTAAQVRQSAGVQAGQSQQQTGQSAAQQLSDYLRAHFSRVEDGDYVALLAYVQRCDATTEILQSIRRRIQQSTRAATCLGFGPRFLHSTGQLYKGGPNSGVFLQITCDDAADLPIPGHKYTFGVVKAAQALGDLQVLCSRGRRVLRVHLSGTGGGGSAASGTTSSGADICVRLAALEQAITEALQAGLQ